MAAAKKEGKVVVIDPISVRTLSKASIGKAESRHSPIKNSNMFSCRFRAFTKNLVNSAPFLVTVANKAPHPNAAIVFVNWLASKEALELYSRGYSTATLTSIITGKS